MVSGQSSVQFLTSGESIVDGTGERFRVAQGVRYALARIMRRVG